MAEEEMCIHSIFIKYALHNSGQQFDGGRHWESLEAKTRRSTIQSRQKHDSLEPLKNINKNLIDQKDLPD